MINTQYLSVSASIPDPDVVSTASAALEQGGLVAFPTETVYGLAADAFNDSAIRKIFEAKGRPSDNPLIVHIADISSLSTMTASFPDVGTLLARTFWPGPLTLVARRTDRVSDLITAGLDTVAVRMPNHPVALALIRRLGRGIVAPSANISGRPSPTTARRVFEDLNGKIDVILDAGPTRIGIESTVLDVTMDPPVILRKGGLAREAIETVIGPVRADVGGDLDKRSPGNRYKHYAPRARVILVKEGDGEGLREVLRDVSVADSKIGCILHSMPGLPASSSIIVRHVAPDFEEITRVLFESFREFDNDGVDVIVVEEVEERGLGTAIMDRLRRAAGLLAEEEQ